MHFPVFNVDGAALAKLDIDMEAFKVKYANHDVPPADEVRGDISGGVLVSLVSAALLHNSRFLPARVRLNLRNEGRRFGLREHGYAV
ncbi:MAG TPA: hypothetical protein VGC19_07355 [Rhodanobacter sp.]